LVLARTAHWYDSLIITTVTVPDTNCHRIGAALNDVILTPTKNLTRSMHIVNASGSRLVWDVPGQLKWTTGTRVETYVRKHPARKSTFQC